MNSALAFVSVGWVALAGCQPDLGDPESLVTRPRILGVRADPPEAAEGVSSSYRALVATPAGTMSDPGIDWAFCAAPKPLTDDGAVSTACLASDVTPIGGPSPSITAAMPSDACDLFGPDTPPGSYRPQDPDATGGFYQPVRLAVSGLTAFELERVTCDLPDAPVALAIEYAHTYEPNRNPTLAPVTASVGGATIALDHVSAGAEIELQTGWGATGAETYVWFDPGSSTLLQRREAMRVSWFVTGGALSDEVTGRAEDDPMTTTSTTWTAPSMPGEAHLWVVLRDSRGGSDFASYTLTVE